MCGDAAARKRYQRARVGIVLGHVRSAHRRADDTGGARLTAVEKFDVNLLWRHADRGQRLFHVGHECCRSADVDIRLAREADRIEDRSRQPAGGIEIFALPVIRAGPAVANIEAAIRECRHKGADFRDEGMMLPIAGRMQPQYLPC